MSRFKPGSWFGLLSLQLTLACALSTSTASASLIGDAVDFEWVIIPGGTIIGPDSAVVGPGVEFDEIDFAVDVDASSILVTSKLSVSESSAFDWIFSDLDWLPTPGKIDDAQLTLLQGQPESEFSVSFTDNSVTVSNQAFVSNIELGEYFRVDITASHTPEPSAFAVWCVLGLISSNWRGRRRP